VQLGKPGHQVIMRTIVQVTSWTEIGPTGCPEEKNLSLYGD